MGQSKDRVRNVLHEARDSGAIITVYLESGSFTGRVAAVDTVTVVLREVGPDGSESGRLLYVFDWNDLIAAAVQEPTPTQ